MQLTDFFKTVPLGMVTVVLPNNNTIKTLYTNDFTETSVPYEEITCVSCVNGIATLVTQSKTISMVATNGADINEDSYYYLTPEIQVFWDILFEQGLLQPSILLKDNGDMYANPLDSDPVEFSENFTED